MAKKLLKTLFVNGYKDLRKIKIMGIIEGKLHIIDENNDHYHLALAGEHPPIKLGQEEIIEDFEKIDDTILQQLDPEEREEIKEIVKNIVKPIGYKPRGWSLMNEFIDEAGNVFHKGVIQPELKGKITDKGSSYVEKENPLS